MRRMKDSGIAWIGEIPEEWSSTPLLSVFHERKCKNIGLKEKNVLSLSYGKIIKRNIETNMGLMPASFETYNIVENMNIVLRLTDLQNDKTSLRTGLVTENGIITSAYTTLEANDLKDTRFFSFLLRCYDELKVLYNMGNGVRQNLKFGELSQLPVLLPPFSEQHRIADYLDTKCAEIDRSMELVREGIDKLKEYKKSVITEAVTKGLDPDVPMKDSGVPWIGEIPKNWEVYDLKHLVNLITDGTHKTPDYQPVGIPFLSIKDVSSGKLDFSDTKFISREEHNILKKRANVEKGDIIFTRIGTLGIAVEIKEDNEFSIFVSLGLIKANINKILPKFLCYIMGSNYYFNYIQTVKAGGDTAAAKFNLKDVAASPIICPSLVEQRRIASYLDAKCAEIDTLITQKQALLDKLAEYKKSLIFECVTGKREVAA